jgi:glutathione S-transferase
VTELTLHNYDLDDQCYKVRLLLAALGCRYVKRDVDVHPGHQECSVAYRKLNPFGALPIITEGAFVLYGAEAILVYLASRFDATRAWLPDEPTGLGRVMQWLAFAGGDLQAASLARAHALLEVEADEQHVQHASRGAFRVMDDHLTRREFDDARWFVGDAPTIADIALFPAIALSRDFGIDHDEYPALRRWMARVRIIPGFLTMPGIPSYH